MKKKKIKSYFIRNDYYSLLYSAFGCIYYRGINGIVEKIIMKLLKKKIF